MTKNFYQRHRQDFQKAEGLLLKNTVLEKGLVVAPIVVMSNSLKNSVMLAIAFAMVTFFTVLVTTLIPKRLAHTLRAILYALTAAIVYIPTAILLDQMFPGETHRLGIFLPLMITNSLIIWRSDSRFHKMKLFPMARDLFFHILGFAVVICLAGFIRELFGNGLLWGVPVDWISVKPLGLLLPFGGFILLGFIAAVLQRYKHYLTGTSFEDSLPIDVSLEDYEGGYNTVGELHKTRREVTDDE